MRLHIHIGYPKSGSTFLQEHVFTSNPGLNYLGKTLLDYPEWLIQWHYWDDLEFERRHHEIRDKLAQLCVANKPNVLSSEMFTMHGGEAAAQLGRIHTIAPDAHLIVVLRNPIERIKSFYKHLVREGHIPSLEDSIDWKRTPMVFYKRRPIYLPDYYYDELLGTANTLFGGRVTVLRHEDMAGDPAAFVSKLSDSVGVELVSGDARELFTRRENTAQPDEQVDAQRFRNAVARMRALLPSYATSPDEESEFLRGPHVLLHDSLKDKLVTQLRGRCAGYY